MKTAVIIPAFNEESRISEVIKKTIDFADFIIVVDDGSGDNTYQVANKFEEKVIALKHKINLGKGAAMKTGCEAAQKKDADLIIFMDADGQHNPKDIPRFIKKFQENDYDIVFGSRKIGKDMPLVMMLGNKFLSISISLLFRLYISDTQSGFRAFKRDVYEKIKWSSNRYAVESEMIVNAAKSKLKVGEIEIATIYKDDYKGTTVLDGIRIFINLLIWRIL